MSDSASDNMDVSGDEMQVEDEDDVNVDVLVDEDGEGDPEEDGEGDAEAEGELEDELEDEEEPEPPKPVPSKLKIKLKLPAHMTETRTPTPASGDVDVESEDDFDPSEDEMPATTRPLTARQAVKRGVVESSHVTLDDPDASTSRGKKKQLNETELALKREETARKRRNLSEKKLEDEKTETINRLLRKQSRARGRRNALATAEDPDEADADAEAAEEPIVEVAPTMYRWVSTSRPSATENGEPATDGGAERKMTMMFAVPADALPAQDGPAEGDGVGMQVDGTNAPTPARPEVPHPTVCAIDGCSAPRKYRLVSDWSRGACGMEHLKALEVRVVS